MGKSSTSFKPGNTMYRIAKNPGRKKIYQTEEELTDKINEYFEYMENNPILEEDIINRTWVEWEEYENEEGKTKTRKITHPYSKAVKQIRRPFTQKGLCLYLGISEDTYRTYRQNPEFNEVITRADDIIFNQKFEGATVNLFNANIIARDLGLIDRKDHTTGGAKIGQSVKVNIKRN